ncbi:MAG: lipoyl synthase [Patescibacteria group bacterium]
MLLTFDDSRRICYTSDLMESPNITLLSDPQKIRGMRGKPAWFKIKLPSGAANARFEQIRKTAREGRLATVCEEAKCPNIYECWGGGTATFMVMGDTCTRACRFCAVKTGNPEGILDADEPRNLSQAIRDMKLDYAVVTSVDRDDIFDGGAGHFAECIREVKKLNPELILEVLTPDFAGNLDDVKVVAEAKPHVFGHNVETVPRLQKSVRDSRANYEQSLAVLQYVKEYDKSIYTKSAIMLGLGEEEEEVVDVMKDLRRVGVDVFTIGQYLRPSSWHLAIEHFIKPEQFEWYRKKGEELGFLYVAAGPFVRSSYKAGELFMKNIIRKKSAK